MLLSVGLPKTFLGRSCKHRSLCDQQMSIINLNFKTPMEAWSGEPPDYSGLKVFGSLAFAHVKQGKLAARAVKCMFIGNPEGVKGYKLWNWNLVS